MAFKRTTRSGRNGAKTTITHSTSKSGTNSSKLSSSVGGKNTRFTTTTDLKTGASKSYVTTKSGGWTTRRLVSSPSKTTSIPKRRFKKYKSPKPVKTSTLILLALILIILSYM